MKTRRYYLKCVNKRLGIDTTLGIITIIGETYDGMDGNIQLFDGVTNKNSELLWFPDYNKYGRKYYDREFLKDFIKYRSSDPDRPQLYQHMKEIGMKKYDRLQLFLYAKGRVTSDWLIIEEIK